MKHFAVIQADNTILVKTPNPYVVTTCVEYDPDTLEATRHRLSEACKFLWNCLAVLRIKTAEAKTMGYTLNKITGDILTQIAMRRPHVSHAFRIMISNYDW
jgi:hypothetical protein